MSSRRDYPNRRFDARGSPPPGNSGNSRSRSEGQRDPEYGIYDGLIIMSLEKQKIWENDIIAAPIVTSN